METVSTATEKDWLCSLDKITIMDRRKCCCWLAHSFVHCLDTFMTATDHVICECDECRTTCRLLSVGGLSIDGLFLVRMVDKVGRFIPGLLMVEIGTNDAEASCDCVWIDEDCVSICDVVFQRPCSVHSDSPSWPWMFNTVSLLWK